MGATATARSKQIESGKRFEREGVSAYLTRCVHRRLLLLLLISINSGALMVMKVETKHKTREVSGVAVTAHSHTLETPRE
eukprot:256608-Rhodomonas_salina.1